MASDHHPKPPLQRPDKAGPKRRTQARHNLLLWIASLMVAALIGMSLLVSVTAIMEKIRIGNGVRQIIQVVDQSRRIAKIDRMLGANGQEDLLLRLDRIGVFQSSAPLSDRGLYAISNPWDGMLTAFTVSDNLMRIESNVPSYVCAHLALQFTRDIKNLGADLHALGLQQVDVRFADEAGRNIYSESEHSVIGETEILAGCENDKRVNLALTFTLH